MKPASASPTMPVALSEALLTTIIWGSSFVVAKIGLRTIGPFTLAGLRHFLAFLLLSPFLLVRLRRNGWPDRGTLRQLALLGITAYLLGNGALFIALQFVPATLVAFMMSLGPIFILIGSLVSFVVAVVVVKAFVSIIQRYGFAPFAWYRIIVGAVALVWLAMR